MAEFYEKFAINCPKNCNFCLKICDVIIACFYANNSMCFTILYYLQWHFKANYWHFEENYLPGSIPNKKLGSWRYYKQWSVNHLQRFHLLESRCQPSGEDSLRLDDQGLSRHCNPRCTQTHLKPMQLYAFHRNKFRRFVELENQAQYQIARVFLAS